MDRVHDLEPTEERPGAGVAPPLILGPHCEYCPARGACPAFAADALSLARGHGLIVQAGNAPVGALTVAESAYLAGIIPAMRRALDSAEAAVQAHVRAYGPLELSNGQTYSPEIETVTSYDTRKTFDVLEPVVGEALANDAAEYTGASLKRALEAAGAPRGAWSRLKKSLEAAGAVVVAGREVWRRRHPAKPVEVDDELQAMRQAGAQDARVQGDLPQGVAGTAGDEDDPALRRRVDDRDGGQAPGGDARGGDEVPAPSVPSQVAARGPCSHCGRPYSLPGGLVRVHYQPAPRRGVKCLGSGEPPGPENRIVELVAALTGPKRKGAAEPARAQRPAGEEPRQLAIVGA